MGLRGALRRAWRGPDPPTVYATKATNPPPQLLSEAIGLTRDASTRQRNYNAYLNTLVTIPAVGQATSVIAYNFAAAPILVLSEDDTEIDIKADMPALYRLLKKPSPRLSGFRFRELIAYDFLLTGNAIVAMDSFQGIPGGQVVPTELFRLRPDWVRIVATSDGEVYYGYAPGGFRSIKETTWYAEEEILHCAGANPLDDYWGLGTVEMGEIALDADKLMNEFTRNYFDRGAILEGILTTDQILTSDQSLELRTMWRAQKEGQRNQMKTAVLGQGTTYQPIQEPLGNIPLEALRKMSKAEVFALWGVPLQLVGDFSSGNYHNSQQALSFFFQNTMVPTWTRFTEFWDELVTIFGTYHTDYDSQVQDPDFLDKAKGASLLATTGSFKRNDIREAAGYDALEEGDPRGDELIVVAQNFQVIPDEGGPPLENPLSPTQLLGPMTVPVPSQPLPVGGQTNGTGTIPVRS